MFIQGLWNIITHLNYYDFYVGYNFQAQLKEFEQMMPLFFVCYPTFSTFSTLPDSDMIDILNIFKEFFNEVLTSHYFVDILIGVLNLIFLISIILVIANTFKHKIIISKASQQHQKCMKISFIYIQFQYILLCLIQPLYCIVYYNINKAFEQKAQIRLTNLSISFLLIIFQQIIHHLFLNSDLLLYTKQYRRINDSFALIFHQTLLFLQPVVFTFFTIDQAIPLQIVIIILINIIYSVKVWHTKLLQHNKQIQLIFIFVSITTIIITQIILNQNKFLMLLIISPLLYYIQKTIWKQHIQRLLLAEPQQLNQNNINFIICLLFSHNQIDHIFQNKLNLFILVNQHINKCLYSKCQCNKFKDFDIFTSSIKLFDFYKEYFIQSIKLNNRKQIRENFHLYCHYLSSLDLLGKYKDILIETNSDNSLNFETWTIIEKLKFTSLSTYLKQQQYNRLLEKIMGNQEKDIQLEIDDFLQTESKIAQIKIYLKQLILIKIDYLNIIHVKDGNDQFNQILKFAKYKQKIENFLNILYSSFSGVKIKSILMFYYAEVVNDWFKAYDYKMAQSNDQFSEFRLQNHSVCYLVCSYNQTNLILDNYSKQAINFFNQEDVLKKSSPIMIIPRAVKDIHQQYIDNFLETGKSKYFQKKEPNIYEAKQGILTPCIFFQDIYYNDMNQFKFLTFYEQQQSSSLVGYILIDKDNNISGISQDFITMINSDQSYVDEEIMNLLNNMPFDIFFKKINNQCLLNIPKSKYCKLILSKPQQQKIKLLQQQDYLRNIELNCQFHQRESYIIIKVFSYNELEQNEQIVIQVQQSDINDYHEQDQVIIPYSDEDGTYTPIAQFRQILTQLSPRIDSVQLTNRNKLIVDKENSQIDTLDQRSEKNIKDDEIQTIKILGDVYAYDFDRQSGIINEQQSCASSLAGIKRSKYFQKYYLYHRLINNNSYGKWKNLIIIVCLLFISVQILFCILSLNFVMKDFNSMEKYYQSVQVNHFFIEPLQKFFLTRYTSVLNSMQLRTQDITLERLNFLNTFNKPNLGRQYLDFKLNYHEHFDDPSLKEFINDKYLNVSFKKGEYTSKIYLEHYNMTLAMAFSELTETFYRGYLHYTKQPEPSFTTSAGFVFQYANYMKFVNIFDQVSNQVTEYSQYRTQQDTIKWEILIAIISSSSFIILFLFYRYSLKLKKQCETLLNLSQMIDVDQIYTDLKRYQFLLSCINSNTSDLLQRYQFNLDQKESNVQKHDKLTPSFKKQNKQDYPLQNKQKLYITRKWSVILIIFCCIYTSAFLISITVTHTTYQWKFPNTIQLLKQSSDLGVYLPAIFSYFQIIRLFANVPFLNDQDKQEFINQVQLGANSIDQFQILILKKQDYQFSNNKLLAIQQSAQSDICPQLNASKYENFQYFCYNSYNGLLRRGLNLALAQYKQDTDMALSSNFTQIPDNRQLEMESVYLASDQLSTIVSKIIFEIQNENNLTKQLLISLISISLAISMISFYFVYFSQYVIENKIQASKFVIWMLPQSILFLNDNFEREVRMIGFKEDIL